MILLLQLAAAADTVLVRNVPPVRTTFEQIVFVASGLTSILLLLLVVVLVVGLLVLRAKADQVQGKLDKLIADLSPMAANANEMSIEVREVARNVNAMVADSRTTVTLVNDRVRKSVVKLTDEIDDLSDMVGRVNTTAERVSGIASTAMTGLKVGASALGFGRKRKKARGAKKDAPRLRRRD